MSTLFSVNWKDSVKGLIVSVISGVLVYVYGILNSGSLAIDWKQVLIVTLSSGLSYIIKNYLTTDDGKFAGVI